MSLSRAALSLLVPLSVACSLALGCGPTMKLPSVDGDAEDGTCHAKDPLNPFIVEWPATSKVQLDSVSQRGVVVVAFDGCNLKVLNGCDASGAYEFQSVTPAKERMEIADKNDLGAKLPLGFVTLGGAFSEGKKLVLDYVAVGERRTPEPPGKLENMCDGATHYVRTITLGAYTLDAVARAAGGIDAKVSDIGVDAFHSENQEHMRGSGDVRACSQAAAMSIDEASEKGCAAVIQLGLAPLAAGKGEASGDDAPAP